MGRQNKIPQTNWQNRYLEKKSWSWKNRDLEKIVILKKSLSWKTPSKMSIFFSLLLIGLGPLKNLLTRFARKNVCICTHHIHTRAYLLGCHWKSVILQNIFWKSTDCQCAFPKTSFGIAYFAKCVFKKNLISMRFSKSVIGKICYIAKYFLEQIRFTIHNAIFQKHHLESLILQNVFSKKPDFQCDFPRMSLGIRYIAKYFLEQIRFTMRFFNNVIGNPLFCQNMLWKKIGFAMQFFKHVVGNLLFCKTISNAVFRENQGKSVALPNIFWTSEYHWNSLSFWKYSLKESSFCMRGFSKNYYLVLLAHRYAWISEKNPDVSFVSYMHAYACVNTQKFCQGYLLVFKKISRRLRRTKILSYLSDILFYMHAYVSLCARKFFSGYVLVFKKKISAACGAQMFFHIPLASYCLCMHMRRYVRENSSRVMCWSSKKIPTPAVRKCFFIFLSHLIVYACACVAMRAKVPPGICVGLQKKFPPPAARKCFFIFLLHFIVYARACVAVRAKITPGLCVGLQKKFPPPAARKCFFTYLLHLIVYTCACVVMRAKVPPGICVGLQKNFRRLRRANLHISLASYFINL